MDTHMLNKNTGIFAYSHDYQTTELFCVVLKNKMEILLFIC